MAVSLFILVFTGGNFTATSAANDHFSSQRNEPNDEFFTIDAVVIHTRKENGSWSLMSKVSVKPVRETDKEIIVSYQLKKLSDDKFSLLQVADQQLFKKSLTKRSTENVVVSIPQLSVGQYD